jgi:hypothetical protein
MRAFLLLISLCFLIVSAKDWSKVNYDALEEEWESGDEIEELEKTVKKPKPFNTENLKNVDPKTLQKKFGKNKKGPDPMAGNSGGGNMIFIKLVANSPTGKPWETKELNSMAGNSGGGNMIFIKLVANSPTGKPWETKELNFVAGKWVSLLKSASLAAQVYNVDEKTMLINVPKAWLTNDVMKFVALQPEVANLELSGKTYTKSDFYDDDGDEL